MINFLLPKLKFTNVSWKLLKKRQISFIWYVHKIFWWKTNVSYALIGARTYQGARGKKCQCFENFFLLTNEWSHMNDFRCRTNLLDCFLLCFSFPILDYKISKQWWGTKGQGQGFEEVFFRSRFDAFF